MLTMLITLVDMKCCSLMKTIDDKILSCVILVAKQTAVHLHEVEQCWIGLQFEIFQLLATCQLPGVMQSSKNIGVTNEQR